MCRFRPYSDHYLNVFSGQGDESKLLLVQDAWDSEDEHFRIIPLNQIAGRLFLVPFDDILRLDDDEIEEDGWLIVQKLDVVEFED
jgi:hypothetical protein